jgi:nucleoside-diphosphate-sugar epimerase
MDVKLDKNYAGLRVLITGANGFLGSRLIKKLIDLGAFPTGMVRERATLHELEKIGIKNKFPLHEIASDYSNLDLIINNCYPDIVVHTASASRVKENAEGLREMISANITFPALLIESMLRHETYRFVNIGTSWQSSNGNSYSPFNFYAATKQSIENIVQHYSDNAKLRAVTIRLFDTYGPYDNRPKIMNLIMKSILSNEALDMSPGNQKMHFVHINDVVDGILHSIINNNPISTNHEIYDMVSEKSISLRDLTALIEKIAQKKAKINWGGREYRIGEIMDPQPSNGALPGFIPTVSLESGISNILQTQ